VCGPFTPGRPPTALETIIVLIDPHGREREVYRGYGEKIPGPETFKTVRKENRRAPIVVEVSNQAWRRARVSCTHLFGRKVVRPCACACGERKFSP
jgi:hypothetical protein